MLKLILNIKFVIGLAVVIIVGVGSYAFFQSGNKDSSLVVVKRDTIKEEVRMTGKVISTHSANLGFEMSGKVKQVVRSVGDKVYQGDTLAILDTTDAEIQLRQAEATVLADKAAYLDIKQGTRLESLAVSESKLKSAESSLVDAISQLGDKIRESYTKADNAIHNKVDQFLINPNSPSPSISFSVTDPQLEADIKNGRREIESDIETLKGYYLKTWHDESVLSDSNDAKIALIHVTAFLNNIALAVNNLTSSSELSATTIATYQSDVSTARSDIDSIRAGILTVEEKVRSARNAVSVAQNDLALLKAGSTENAIAVAFAKFQQSEAASDKIRAEINKSYLRSPIKGVVTKMDIEKGEVVNSQTTIASVIGDEGYEIEFYIPEVDIGRVALGNTVRVTLDAYLKDQFMGKLVYIDPAETIIDGVVNFKGTVVLDNDDGRLKSGLTANLYVLSFSKDNVLVVPDYAVSESENGSFVALSVNGKPVKTPVELGFRSAEGFVEIVSGLSEGDSVYNLNAKDDNGNPIITL